jgi:hypothetical protein
MKMDAMLKRKIWKVAMAHFALSALILVVFAQPSSTDSMRYLWFSFLEILQPIFWLMTLAMKQFLVENWSLNLSAFLSICFLIVIPLWSICFGWLYVKFTNWLNHFPVLGKKVF